MSLLSTPDLYEPEISEQEEALERIDGEPRLYHFKVLYDQSWDYKKICARLFDNDKQYLCVLEHVNQPNTHVHFQGYSNVTEDSFRSRLKRLAHKHHLRKLNPKCRPTSMVHRPPDVKGFQYMAKEMQPNYVLAVNMFSQEDLEKLKEESVLHCKQLKFNVKEYIAGLPAEKIREIVAATFGGNQIVDNAGRVLWGEAARGRIELPEYSKHHTRTSIIRGLLANPHVKADKKGLLYAL